MLWFLAPGLSFSSFFLCQFFLCVGCTAHSILRGYHGLVFCFYLSRLRLACQLMLMALEYRAFSDNGIAKVAHKSGQ